MAKILPAVSLLISAILPACCVETGQRLCEQDRRFCITGLCPIDECLMCFDKEAICETPDPDQLVPKMLPKTIKFLTLTYTGPGAELKPDMFENFSQLKVVAISGNISSVAPNTFAKQRNLKSLTITDSSLNSLPDKIFSNISKLEDLNLLRNQFTKIPVNVFPNILNVERIDLSYNPLYSCTSYNETIATEFEMLNKLDMLTLAGYGSSKELCQNISQHYLSPIRQVRVLDLSESLLFYGDQRILSPLVNLLELRMNNVEPYKYCPALAKELFHNLPEKVNKITLRNWASTALVNDSCTLGYDALDGLKKMKKLAFLDARYGDKLFGNTLTKSTFEGFNRIKTIYIHWCGIASIESGSLNAVPHLVDLGLEGNLLGPRILEPYTNNQTPSKLKTLNLKAVGINIAHYDASRLLIGFPILYALYLDDNLLKSIPDFGASRNVSSTVNHLTLNNNDIQSLSTEVGEKLCKVMPSLHDLRAENNKMSDVTGIVFCSSLERLYLAHNLVGNNQFANFRAIQTLHQLYILHLSHNKIKYLTPEIFTNFTRLTTLNLANNEITTLASDVFMGTPILRFLDLSANFLTDFNPSIVSKGLSLLVSLYLQANQITVLSPELLENISMQLTKLEIIGLVGNPLKCSCDSYLSNWVRNSSSVIMQVKNLTCSSPNDEDTITKVLDFEPDHFQCNVKHIFLLAAKILAAVVVSILLALPCYKYRWYISHPKVVARAITEKLNEVQFDQKCEYDAFISYNTGSNKDSKWIAEKLIPAIEKVSSDSVATNLCMKLYVVDRDSAVGSPKYTERCRAIENSRKIIILLSNSYLANPDCLSEADLVAGYQLLDGQHCYQPNRILVLILEDLNEEAIKAPMTSLLTENVIHVTNSEAKMKILWRQVRRFISKPKYVFRQRRVSISRRKDDAIAPQC